MTTDRINFSGLLSETEIVGFINNPALKILQTDKPVEPRTWSLLEEHFFKNRPEVTLRIYGHADSNLSFLKLMPSLSRFEANCLTKGTNLESLANLANLDYLNIGIESLESFDFLNLINPNLKSLTLGPTKSPKPKIDCLTRFSNLESLGICDNRKNLDLLSTLKNLEKLSLISSKNPNLSFLSLLPKLWSLEIILGGATDLSAISSSASLKHLELSWIRGLQDISFISRCTSLQRLTLDKLKQVNQLPDFSNLKKLRRLTLASMNGLHSVDNIKLAPALEIFSGSAEKLSPENFTGALQAPALRAATVYFPSKKNSETFTALASKYGVNSEPSWEEFIYV